MNFNIMIKKNSYLGLLVGFITFTLLGLLHRDMGFDSDSFSVVFFSSQIKNFHEGLKAINYPISQIHDPLDDEKSVTPDTFWGYYRPIWSMCHFICYRLCGPSPLVYYLGCVLLHSLTALFLYFIYAIFLTPLWSFLLALLFAFHPIMVPAFIGYTCVLTPFNVFFALAVLAYMKYMRNSQMSYYVCAAFCFFLSLLSYELAISAPAVLFVYLLLFKREHIFRDSYLIFVVTFIYLMVRAFVVKNSVTSLTTSFPASFSNLYFNIYSHIKPFWGLEGQSKILAGVLTFFFIAAIAYYFLVNYRNSKKVLFYLIATALFSWPLVTHVATERSFYLAIPFFCLVLYELVTFFIPKLFPQCRLAVYSVPFIFLVCGIVRAQIKLSERELYTQKRDAGWRTLVKTHPEYRNKKLIFVVVIFCYNGHNNSLMQRSAGHAARIFFNDPGLRAYHPQEINVTVINGSTKGLDVVPIKGGYRFISQDPENVYFDWHIGNAVTSMVEVIINHRVNSWKVDDVSVVFHDKWLDQKELKDTVFLTWDLSNWCFKELDKNHLIHV